MSAANDIQTAIFSAVAPVVPGQRLYGRAPNTPVYPYVTIKPVHLRPEHDHGSRYERTLFVLDVWSRPNPNGGPASQKEANDILQTIRAAIDRKPLSLPSGSAFKHISTLEIDAFVVDENDGLTFHGVYQTEIIVAPKAA